MFVLNGCVFFGTPCMSSYVICTCPDSGRLTLSIRLAKKVMFWSQIVRRIRQLQLWLPWVRERHIHHSHS
jgi:hypothetical protein